MSDDWSKAAVVDAVWRGTVRREHGTVTLPREPRDMREGTGPSYGRIINTGQVPVPLRWQTTHDEVRNAERSLRWWGRCPVCGHNVWAFDDGENDPRGVLGDNALWPSTFELLNDVVIEVNTCAVCANDEPMYRVAENIAKRKVRGIRGN